MIESQKKIYASPKMKRIEIDITDILCQSPGSLGGNTTDYFQNDDIIF